MKKKIVFVLLVALLMLYFNPVKIDVEIPLVEIAYGENDIKAQTFIRFSGSKYKRVFKKSYFEGTITIGDEVIKLARVNLNSFDLLTGVDSSTGDGKIFATAYVNASFDEVTLLVLKNGSWSSREGHVLTGPVENHDKAIDLINKHMRTHNVFREDLYQ